MTPSEKMRMLLAEIGVPMQVSANGTGSGDPRKCDPRIVVKAYNIARGTNRTVGEYIAVLKAAHPENAELYDKWCAYWGVDLNEVA